LKTKAEILASDLRGIADGVMLLQREMDVKEAAISDLKEKIVQKDEAFQVVNDAAAEQVRAERWQRVSSDTPPEGKELLVRDDQWKHYLAVYEGASGWFNGDSRLKVKIIQWMRIPKK